MASSSESLSILKELFPDWSTEDLTSCLEESRGELDTAITRISEGHATKFGEVTKKKEKAPKRVEYGNGRGRGRGASTGAPRGRSEFRGRGRGRGASTSTGPTDRTAVETTPSWAENAESTPTSTLPAWATEDATTGTKQAPQESSQAKDSRSEEPVAQAATTGLFSAPPKPKARIVDKNSTSSWASVARPVAQAQPAQQAAATNQPSQSIASESSANKLSVDDKTAPLTERNLEAVTEDQQNVPQPPAATVASLQGEPATGPPSVAGASQTGPPGLKSSQQTSAARVGTPIGGRRLNQNEAVVMPGSEREPAARLGVQFGSLGLSDEEVYNDKNNVQPQQQKLETSDLRSESNSQQSRQDRPQETYAGYGAQGGPIQQHQQQQQQPYGGQAQDHYASMSNFYGQNDQARASPFGGHNEYYGQHTSQHPTQPPYGLQSGASQRSDATSRPTEPISRFGEPSSSPMTSMTSQPPHSTASPAPSHLGAQQQQQHQTQFPMHPQYGAPNPYAYYGYGYGYPQQQQHSAYGGQMYGQQQQRGGYGGQGQQYPGAPVSHQPVGTSQDRFERSTAEYQRQQQQTQYPQSGFGNNDFLGGSRNQQPSSETLDPFKGYNSNPASANAREEPKSAPTGFGSGSQASFGQQTPSGSQYGSHASGQYGEQQGQQNQFSQYGSYGRQSGHQQYGGGQWNQY
ncbi:protein of unknown function [Taphrina deformans PYCC 5710]|uniref:RNA polymerase II degradation factor 1 n=1 Tax=Taphrina deformans (strain PYCC 5710 / ATCC 11124 / CBS 356.35 / IMI 108563 / JCM 9778 / NBRC 8474) TaxID=1097556 RepID=R4XCY7_TAPDE|nr:protein of unknown function [Taphrina deformans PYCC 5710]|eukprot:CCG82273.1 protein of unknown function [Taphrina deformans PYCC 5710]